MSALPTTIDRVDRLDCTLVPRDWDFTVREAKAIDAHWVQCVTKKPALFDGRVLLLHHAKIEHFATGPVFQGEYLETDFRNFLSWRDFGHPRGVNDPYIRNCFAMAALLSSDGAFLLGEMGAHTANAGKIYFPAGTPDPSDLVGHRIDLEGSVLRELEEETGIHPDHVTLDAGWTLLSEGSRIACMKIVRLAEPAEKAVAQVAKTLERQSQPELSRLHIVRNMNDCPKGRMPNFMLSFLEQWFVDQG